MSPFLIYEAKVAVALLVFYLFYRFLLKKETLHRLNRFVLTGSMVLSFILPLCIITVHRHADVSPGSTAVQVLPIEVAGQPVVAAEMPWWSIALTAIFWAGSVFVTARIFMSLFSISGIIRRGRVVESGIEGVKLIVTGEDIDPFSWMKYIVIPEKDMTGNHSAIISHELAHIRCGHSMELLLMDLAAAFQWFNPAVWMLRSDLQELHEYEADDAVLRTGADIKEYQYLLIRKAVGRSGYSIANSFNHSILKNRITMMSKSKSPLLRGFRALYLLPIVCLGIGLQAKTVYVSSDKDSKILYILRSSRDYEGKEISRAEFEQLDRSRIESIDVIKNPEYCEKYGKRAEDGVVVVKLKREQELPEIVVVKNRKMDTAIPFYLLNPDTMPKFQGGDMKEFCKWLNSRLVVPETCTHSGTMKVSFVVDSEGNVINVEVDSSVCEELDAMVVEAIKQSPKWEPAMDRGKPCPQCLVIPIEFCNR